MPAALAAVLPGHPGDRTSYWSRHLVGSREGTEGFGMREARRVKSIEAAAFALGIEADPNGRPASHPYRCCRLSGGACPCRGFIPSVSPLSRSKPGSGGRTTPALWNTTLVGIRWNTSSASPYEPLITEEFRKTADLGHDTARNPALSSQKAEESEPYFLRARVRRWRF